MRVSFFQDAAGNFCSFNCTMTEMMVNTAGAPWHTGGKHNECDNANLMIPFPHGMLYLVLVLTGRIMTERRM